MDEKVHGAVLNKRPRDLKGERETDLPRIVSEPLADSPPVGKLVPLPVMVECRKSDGYASAFGPPMFRLALVTLDHSRVTSAETIQWISPRR